MKEKIKVVYQHYIPDSLITEFEKTGIGKKLNIELEQEKTEKKYYNFIGPEISDIVIYIQQHTTELIVGGLLTNIAYDSLKAGLKVLWIGLRKLSVKKYESGGKSTEKQKRISLLLRNKDRNVEIAMNGEINDQQIDKIIDEAFKFINSEKFNEGFKHPDIIRNEKETPTIKLIYNKEKNIWEPENIS
jgi:hypothetical protein